MAREPDGSDAIHLECRGIGKSFGSTRALDGVSLDIRAGSVHALVGENGAGKSTLGKIVAGTMTPDTGRAAAARRGGHLRLPARRARLAASRSWPRSSRSCPCSPWPRTSSSAPSRGAPGSSTGEGSRRASSGWPGIPASTCPLTRPSRSLPLARQQQVEILRALARDAELLVLDEPTASLSGAEAERLHEIVRGFAAQGARSSSSRTS